jgi:ABC-2 type transport system permease protein
MAVYKRNYKRYDGPVTDSRWRFSILPRYSFQGVFASKIFQSFYVICFVPILFALLVMYLRANADILASVGFRGTLPFDIDTRFFTILVHCQCFLTFILAMFVGPGLISPDLANNALPLYLSRPFSREEYIIGKLCVIVTLASLITWIPGLLLFFVQSSLQSGWMFENLRIAAAIFAGSWMWILLVSLMSLAVSAWVKWKPVAAAMLFGIFFVAAAFGELSNVILGLTTKWGLLMDITEVMNMIWGWLFDAATEYRTLPVWSGFASLAIFSGVSLALLWKKIRACEVVR